MARLNHTPAAVLVTACLLLTAGCDVFTSPAERVTRAE